MVELDDSGRDGYPLAEAKEARKFGDSAGIRMVFLPIISSY